MRVFVTGATGFAGSHLMDLLLGEGHQVFALVHHSSSKQALPAHSLVTPVAGDLMDAAGMETAVAAAKPDVVFHLAGQAYPGLSWQKPAWTVAINTGGTANLLQAAAAYGRPRVVVVTSAEIYGALAESDLPVTEQTPPQPRHPYGVSKWAAGQLAALYWQRYELPVIEARPFNHIGPRQALGFVAPDFASQLAAIKLGRQEAKMRVGNLEAQRDFTDVRDVVRAYWALAEHGRPGGSYVICSGQPVSIHTILTILAQLADVRVEIEYDPERMRPSDVPRLYGSYARLRRDTGWQPQIHLRQSLADTLADWLARLQNEEGKV